MNLFLCVFHDKVSTDIFFNAHVLCTCLKVKFCWTWGRWKDEKVPHFCLPKTHTRRLLSWAKMRGRFFSWYNAMNFEWQNSNHAQKSVLVMLPRVNVKTHVIHGLKWKMSRKCLRIPYYRPPNSGKPDIAPDIIEDDVK